MYPTEYWDDDEESLYEELLDLDNTFPEETEEENEDTEDDL